MTKIVTFGNPPAKIQEMLFPDDIKTVDRYVAQVATGDSHVIFLLGNNQIVVCGSNKYGQLGLPKERVSEVLENPEVNSLMLNNENLKAVQIACGKNHSLVLCTSATGLKKLMVFGNEVGLGFGDLQDQFTPRVLEDFEEGFAIENICASSNRSAAYNEKGKVYIWGEDFFGNKIDTPKVWYDFNSKLMSFSIGYLHALAVNGFISSHFIDKLEVFSWGDNSYGELGHDDGKSKEEPTRIDYFAKEEVKVVKVAAGTRFSVVLDVKGVIYSFGCNSVKECGKTGDRFNTPGKVDIFTRDHITGFDIFAGYSHAACVTSTVNE